MSSGWLASPTWTQRSLMKTEHTRETLMLMIRQFPKLVSKPPGISAHTLFVRAYCSFLKGEKKGEGRFPSACHANFAAWRESGFVLSITRITERFERHNLHGRKRKLSLLSSCPAARVLYWHRTKPGNPVQNPLKTVAASVEFWIRKKLDPIPPSPWECNAVQPEGLCSRSSSGPYLYFRARGWVQARFHHLPPSPRVCSLGRVGHLRRCHRRARPGDHAVLPPTGRPRAPRSAQTLQHNTEAFKIVWFFCLVGFCCWLSPSNHQMLK